MILRPELIGSQECQTDAVRSVSLDLSSFRQQQGYSCSLYQENTQQERLIIPYMTQNRMDTCQDFLPDGYYAMFMVPNERWIARWSNIGEMGTVHAMILYRHQGNTLVYQASIDQKAVVSESWDAVSQRLSTVSKAIDCISLISGFQNQWVLFFRGLSLMPWFVCVVMALVIGALRIGPPIGNPLHT